VRSFILHNREQRVTEMKKVLTSCVVAVILLLAAPSQALDTDFRCGNEIISVGDRKFDVQRKCGEPANVDMRQEIRKRNLGPVVFGPDNRIQIYPGPFLVEELVTIEEWEYNLGPAKFIRYLTFENGFLVTIALGDYGY
jgi:hypothetical protein